MIRILELLRFRNGSAFFLVQIDAVREEVFVPPYVVSYPIFFSINLSNAF